MLQLRVGILVGHTTSASSESLIFTSRGRRFPQLTVCLLRAGVPIHATEQHGRCGTPARWGWYTQGCSGRRGIIKVSLQNWSCSGEYWSLGKLEMSLPKHLRSV